MRHFAIVDQKLQETTYDQIKSGKSFCVLNAEEFARLDFDRLPAQMKAVFLDESKTPVLDTHSNFSYCMLNSIEMDDNEVVLEPIRFAITQDTLILVAESSNRFLDKLLDKLSGAHLVQRYEEASPQTLLLHFFDEMLLYNGGHVEKIEDNLELLEEKVLEDAQKGYSREIVAQRKLIMRFRHSIEPLIYILDELSDNENRLFTSAQVKALRIQSRRASKMMDGAILLRDYATQVREAFEAERDIKNNDVMKVFTIVTSIFFPLTLIVGWYGMNFVHMPRDQFGLRVSHGHCAERCGRHPHAHLLPAKKVAIDLTIAALTKTHECAITNL